MNIFPVRQITTATVLALLLVWGGATALGQELPLRPAGITPEAEAAIERGLEYLVRTQSASGRWSDSGAMGPQYPTAMTALSGLAFLAGGHTPVTGQYSRPLRLALDAILKSTTPTGLIADVRSEERPMYGHGFALLFLAEVYGMEPDTERRKRIREVAQAGVALTVRSQSKDGGWNYYPDDEEDEGSVTITQLQALRACRNAGIEVPAQTIERAIAYLEKSANEDGGIAYRPQMKGRSLHAITAAAAVALRSARALEHPLAESTLEYTVKALAQGEMDPFVTYTGHAYYALLYASQALWLAEHEQWNRYFEKTREALLKRQFEDGHWEEVRYPPAFATAIALMTLQLPYGFLPTLQP